MDTGYQGHRHQDEEETVIVDKVLYAAYRDAFTAALDYLFQYPPSHRTPEQAKELDRLTNICAAAKARWEIAISERRMHEPR